MKLAKENLGKVSVTVEKAYHSVNKEYDKLVVVEEEGQFRTFISRKPVPIGTELTDREFWLPFSSIKESIVIDYNKFKQYIRTGEGLLDDSIVTRHIKDRNVTGNKIAEATITFVNIANEGVTLPKINKEAIDTTLTKEGYLAEAKHTGDRLLNVEGLTVIKVPSTQSTVLDAWQIVDKNGNVHGVTINTYKDKSIDAIWLSIREDDPKPEDPEVKVDNPRYLNIVYNKADGTQQKVSIPLASFVTEAEFSKNGFKVINGIVNLKISSDITTSRYFHFDADGNITLDGFEERILEDLGTLEHSQPGDGTMWGEFKKQEEIREQVSNSAHQVFSDNWDEQDDDPEDYDPLAVTEASFAYNWKSITNPNKTGNIEDLVNKVDALAVGIFYGYYPNENELPQDITERGYSYVGTDNPYKIYNFDGTQWKDSNTTIQATSEADEEDITYNENDKLTFKNRNNTDGMGYVILRKNKSFAEQITKENTIYEIRYDFNLNNTNVTIPDNCILKFIGGSINNGTINCNNTFLDGTVNISKITGTICNKYVYASWFSDDNFSENIVSIFNSNSILYLDKDITMDGTNKTVSTIKIEGNGYTIYNSCSYKITSNYVELNNIHFKEYTNKNIFLTFYTDYTEAYLTLNKIEFDGNNNCNRFFNWFDTVKKLHLNLNINNCVFCNIRSAVIRHCGTSQGFIQNNKFYSIGTLDDANNTLQTCILLGNAYQVTNLANNVIINNNTFYDIKTVFTDKNDGKETHAILIFGCNCIIENNLIKNIYSSREDKDPGAESEGIYVKGSNNKIINNILIDAAGGTNSDGAITLKGVDIQDYYDRHYNIISGNSIIFNNHYGTGITTYGINTNIINNTIKLGVSKNFAIEFLVAEDSLIEGNIISTSPDIIKDSTETVNAAFSILNSKNLIFRNNRLEVGTLCTLYPSDESPIIFENNYILIANNQYGRTSKYVSFFQTSDYTPNVIFNNNYIEIFNIRTSSFWGCQGYLLAKNNYFKIRNKEEHEITTLITCMFRFLHSVILIDNIFDIDESVVNAPVLFYQLQENATAISHNTIFTNRGSINYSSINRNTANIFQKTIGTTEDRNNIKLNYKSDMEGYQFFDTTLGKPCYAKTINNNGIVTWVDATGTNV